jgi:outer membrane receptor protein involved in Fe transport
MGFRKSFFLLVLNAILSAQSRDGFFIVSGTIQDSSGGSLAGAKVELVQETGHIEQTTATNNSGTFRFENVPQGPHFVDVKEPGFRPVRQAVRVGASPLPAMRIVLSLAERREEVTVNGEAATVSAESPDNRNSISVSRQTLQSIPVFDMDYIGTMSRFLSQGDVATGGVTLVVGGVEANGLGVSASAIQEVKINQDPYSAEFSRPGRGRIEVTTVGGTPQYHGTFNFLFRDSIFNARDAFAAAKPSEQRRFYEGSLTGPLKPWSNTFFLLTFNRDEEDVSSVVFAQGPQGAVRENVPSPMRHWFTSARISHQYAGGSLLGLSYSYEDRTNRNVGVGGTVLPEAGTNSQFLEHEINLTYKYVASPKLINQLRAFVGHYRAPMTSLNNEPKLVVLDAFTAGGAQADMKRTEWHFGTTDVASWTSGHHLVKFGASVPDWSRRAIDDFTNHLGTYYFSNLQDYALGKPYSLLLQRGQGRVVFIEKNLAGFVQDEVRLRPNLTLTVGLRYYWQNYFYDKPHNFAPRLACAWAPGKSKKTVVRGGAGMFYDRTGPGPIADLLRSDGLHLLRYLIDNPPYPDPLIGGPAAAAPASIVRLDPRARIPYSMQYSSGVEQQIGKATTLAVNYVGTVFVSSFRSRDINAPLAPGYVARRDPVFGQIRQIESAGRGISNALEVTLRGNITRYFIGTAQYTLSKALNNTGGIAWFPAHSNTFAGEWARADFDQRHRFNLLGSINPGKWFNLGIGLTLNSGRPYSETTGQDTNGDGLANDRPAGVPRNSLEGPGFAQLDLRCARDFYLTHTRDKGPTATIGLDAFNALNHTNYVSYIGTLSSPFFGHAVAANPPRRMQISFRFKF